MPIVPFEMPAYISSPRGGKLDKFKVKKMPDPSDGEVLLLCGPREVADQILENAGKACREARLKADSKFTHGLIFKEGVPDWAIRLSELLKNVVTIPPPDAVDFAIALDFYTEPNDDYEEGIGRTHMGDLINFTKYATHPEYGNSRKARAELLRLLPAFILEHPLYAEATAIITAPGHLADGQSFGEVLAREVAGTVGIPYVETTSSGPRTSQKEAKQNLFNSFTVASSLSGVVIVVDDVYQSGGSASGAAAAARRAGAEHVVSLAVARTIRN